MKKLFFIAAIAGVALASCVKNEPAPSVTQQDEISFAAPVVGLNTKAANEVWNNYPTAKDYNFAVWAHYYDAADGNEFTDFGAGQVYMNEVEVSYNQTLSGWAPATSYYWPKNGSLTFIAYSPASKKKYASLTAEGIQFTNYAVDQDAAKQVDLLFSERAYNKTQVDDKKTGSDVTNENSSVTSDIYKGVHLSFKHALSSILFTAKTAAEYTNTVITLKEIKLIGVNSIGNFNQGLANASTGATETDDDLWVNENTPIDYTVSNLSQVLNNGASYYTSTNSTTAPTAANGLRSSDFILLPQAIPADAKIQVTYTIKSSDSAELTQVLQADLKMTNVEEWKRGFRYIYNIIIGLEEIYFEPYVAPWTDASNVGYNVNL